MTGPFQPPGASSGNPSEPGGQGAQNQPPGQGVPPGQSQQQPHVPGWGSPATPAPDPNLSAWAATPGWNQQAGAVASGAGQYQEQPGILATNVQPGVVPWRPLTVTDIFEGSLKTIRRYPMATIGLSVLGVVVQMLLIGLVVGGALAAGGNFMQWFTETGVGGNPALRNPDDIPWGAVGGMVLAGLVAYLLFLLVQLIVGAVTTHAVGQAVRGKKVPVAALWRLTRPRLLTLVGTMLLFGLIWGAILIVVIGAAALPFIVAVVNGSTGGAIGWGILAFLLYMVGVLVAYVYSVTLVPTVMFENRGPWGCLKSATWLARKMFWRIMLISVLLTIIMSFVVGAISMPLALIAGAVGVAATGSGDANAPIGFQIVSSAIQMLITSLIMPLMLAVNALLYFDGSFRFRGLDANLAADTAGGEPPTTHATTWPANSGAPGGYGQQPGQAQPSAPGPWGAPPQASVPQPGQAQPPAPGGWGSGPTDPNQQPKPPAPPAGPWQ